MKGAKLNLGLQTKLGQKLLITPQMKQSLNLLQMNIVELSTEIDNLLQENPVLEIMEDTKDTEINDKELDSYLETLKKIEWDDFFSDMDEFKYVSNEDEDVDYEKFVKQKTFSGRTPPFF